VPKAPGFFMVLSHDLSGGIQKLGEQAV
jgi:hypothetical protein